MGNTASPTQKQGISESQPLTDTYARVKDIQTHICKYLLNWVNYTEEELNFKKAKSGFFWYSKIAIFVHTEKASHKSNKLSGMLTLIGI